MKDQIQLGKLIEGPAERDAVHVAIAPVVAFRSLSPGEHVGINEEGLADNLDQKLIGIVDPFLKERVPRGGHFWLVLYPNTITSLKHLWEHPAFGKDKPELSEKRKSQEILEGIAHDCGVDYMQMMDAAESGDDINMGSNTHYESVFDSDLFEKHYRIVTGKEPASTYIFSCSC